MTGRSHVVVASDGTALHVGDSGHGPAVVLMHGLACTAAMWTRVQTALLPDRRVLVPDLRGHGASRSVVGGFSLQQQADDVRVLLEQLDIGDVTLVGHSAGGYAALAFAAHHPDVVRERVRAILTIGTSGSVIHARERAVLRFSATRAFHAVYSVGQIGRPLVRLGAFGNHPPTGAVEETRRMALACARETKLEWVRAIVGTAIQNRLANLAVPLVAATGTRDVIVTAKAVGALAASVPSGRAVVLDGAGHMAPCEVPDQVARLVTDQ